MNTMKPVLISLLATICWGCVSVESLWATEAINRELSVKLPSLLPDDIITKLEDMLAERKSSFARPILKRNEIKIIENLIKMSNSKDDCGPDGYGAFYNVSKYRNKSKGSAINILYNHFREHNVAKCRQQWESLLPGVDPPAEIVKTTESMIKKYWNWMSLVDWNSPGDVSTRTYIKLLDEYVQKESEALFWAIRDESHVSQEMKDLFELGRFRDQPEASEKAAHMIVDQFVVKRCVDYQVHTLLPFMQLGLMPDKNPDDPQDQHPSFEPSRPYITCNDLVKEGKDLARFMAEFMVGGSKPTEVHSESGIRKVLEKLRESHNH